MEKLYFANMNVKSADRSWFTSVAMGGGTLLVGVFASRLGRGRDGTRS